LNTLGLFKQSQEWSDTSERIHGLQASGCQKHGEDAYVLYADESKSKVDEIVFRIDANAIQS
jgi:hypothetical protein